MITKATVNFFVGLSLSGVKEMMFCQNDGCGYRSAIDSIALIE